MYWSSCRSLNLFFRHLNDVNRYCTNCGVKASTDSDKDLKSPYTLLEEKLNLFNKKKVAIRGMDIVCQGQFCADYHNISPTKHCFLLLQHLFKRTGVTIAMLSLRIKSQL